MLKNFLNLGFPAATKIPARTTRRIPKTVASFVINGGAPAMSKNLCVHKNRIIDELAYDFTPIPVIEAFDFLVLGLYLGGGKNPPQKTNSENTHYG
ncbi:MAG: hypothetical protein SchgKO_02130 [Schleiferiaceae bacterium]